MIWWCFTRQRHHRTSVLLTGLSDSGKTLLYVRLAYSQYRQTFTSMKENVEEYLTSHVRYHNTSYILVFIITLLWMTTTRHLSNVAQNIWHVVCVHSMICKQTYSKIISWINEFFVILDSCIYFRMRWRLWTCQGKRGWETSFLINTRTLQKP